MLRLLLAQALLLCAGKHPAEHRDHAAVHVEGCRVGSREFPTHNDSLPSRERTSPVSCAGICQAGG
jgi:hypothetical protein